MTIEEVWVVFLEVVVQCFLTVEIDTITVRTHLLLHIQFFEDTLHKSATR